MTTLADGGPVLVDRGNANCAVLRLVVAAGRLVGGLAVALAAVGWRARRCRGAMRRGILLHVGIDGCGPPQPLNLNKTSEISPTRVRRVS